MFKNPEDENLFRQVAKRYEGKVLSFDGKPVKDVPVKIVVRKTQQQIQLRSGKSVWRKASFAKSALRNGFELHAGTYYDTPDGNYAWQADTIGVKHPVTGACISYQEFGKLKEEIYQRLLNEVLEIVPI